MLRNTGANLAVYGVMEHILYLTQEKSSANRNIMLRNTGANLAIYGVMEHILYLSKEKIFSKQEYYA